MKHEISEYVQKLSTLIENGQLGEALDYVETIPQEERENWEIQNLIGVICSYCGEFNEAVSFFRRALKINPDMPDICYNLADAYFSMKEYQLAELMLKRCEYNTTDTDILDEISNMRNEIDRIYKNSPGLKENNEVLMISYFFPPLAGSGVYRSLKFAKYLPDCGWKPTVISTDLPPNGWNFRDDTLVKEIPKTIDVIRVEDKICTGRKNTVSTEEVNLVINFLKGIFQYDKEAMDIYMSAISSKEGITRLITFPCGCLNWAVDVVKYIEKNVDIKKMDVIYTTSGPYSSHLVGFYLKKVYGIPWIADYRDPWTNNPYADFDMSNMYNKLLYRLESVLLKQADFSITTEENLEKQYCEQFKIPKSRMTYITNGYDEEDFLELNKNEEKTKKFTICYSGLLYTQQRSIEPILTSIKQLIDEKKIDEDKICLKTVGEFNKNENYTLASKYGLQNILEQTGYVSHHEALGANLNSDLLLLLVGDEDKFKTVHTGKLFDYLRSGKPILAIAPKNGVVDSILVETKHGETVLSTQLDEIKNKILKQYERWVARSKNEFIHSPLIKLYERKYLTMKLADLLYMAKKNPKQIKEIGNEVYNELYQEGGCNLNYHKHYTESFYYHAWKYALNHLLFLNRNINILEIGCGAGQFANMLFDNGFTNYKGFDYSDEGVKLSMLNNPEHIDKFFVADAFVAPEVEEEHDLIICFEVLEHIQNDLTLLNRIPKGTKLLLSVPNFDDPYHVRCFSSENEVYERYKEVMNIYSVGKFMLTATNCLYYIVGEKL